MSGEGGGKCKGGILVSLHSTWFRSYPFTIADPVHVKVRDVTLYYIWQISTVPYECTLCNVY